MPKTYISDERLIDLAHGGTALPEEIVGLADELRLRRVQLRQFAYKDGDHWFTTMPDGIDVTGVLSDQRRECRTCKNFGAEIPNSRGQHMC